MFRRRKGGLDFSQQSPPHLGVLEIRMDRRPIHADRRAAGGAANRADDFAIDHRLQKDSVREFLLQFLHGLLQDGKGIAVMEHRVPLRRHLAQGMERRCVRLLRARIHHFVQAAEKAGQIGLLLLHHGQPLDHAVNDGFGPRGATRDIDIHRHRPVHPAQNVIAIAENAAGGGACADGHHHFRFRQLAVEVLDDHLALLIDRAGDQKEVGVFGVARILDAEALDIENGRQAGECLDVASIAA